MHDKRANDVDAFDPSCPRGENGGAVVLEWPALLYCCTIVSDKMPHPIASRLVSALSHGGVCMRTSVGRRWYCVCRLSLPWYGIAAVLHMVETCVEILKRGAHLHLPGAVMLYDAHDNWGQPQSYDTMYFTFHTFYCRTHVFWRFDDDAVGGRHRVGRGWG